MLSVASGQLSKFISHPVIGQDCHGEYRLPHVKLNLLLKWIGPPLKFSSMYKHVCLFVFYIPKVNKIQF